MKTWLNKVFMAKDNGDKAIVVEVGLAVIAAGWQYDYRNR